MSNIIKIKKGLKSNLPSLQEGEFGVCTDTLELFLGINSNNKEILTVNNSSKTFLKSSNPSNLDDYLEGYSIGDK
jgi:hypothetical protein